MSNMLNVQELINMCKLHPENESAQKLKEYLEKAQVGHAKSQEKFDIDFFILLWDNNIKINNDAGEINIRKKLPSETNVIEFIEGVLANTSVSFKDDEAKEKFNQILKEIKEKIYSVKNQLENKQENCVIVCIENEHVDFSLTVYRTGDVISVSQSSLGKLDFSKQ